MGFILEQEVNLGNLEYIGAGKLSIANAINKKMILKRYTDVDSDENIERRAYERLSPRPSIAKYLGNAEDGLIILEHGETPRRQTRRRSDTAAQKVTLVKRCGHWDAA